MQIARQWITDDVIGRAKLRDIRYFGGRRGADCTAAFALAFAEVGSVYVPAGDWYATNIPITVAGSRLVTDGFATVIRQDPAASMTSPIINVYASDCIVDSMTLVGNIATSTLEFQAGILVRGNSASISNVTIGDLIGIDLRGDVLYMGCNTGFTTNGVRFGRIIGRNVLRNVVSIVGAAYVRGDAAIAEGGCGYSVCDVEPDTTTSTDVYVGLVKGGMLQCAPPQAANAAKRIHFGTVDLSGTHPNSTPGYSGYTNQIKNAVSLRNTVDIRIDHLKIRGHTRLGVEYIFNPGEVNGESISIGYLDAANIGSADTTYNAIMQVGACKSIRIDAGEVAHDAAGDTVILGDAAARNTRVSIGELRVDGTVVRFCTSSDFNRIRVNTANVANLFRDMTDSVVSNSDLTCTHLGSNIVNSAFVNCNITASTAYIGGTSSNVRMPGTKLAGAVNTGTFTFPAANTTTINTAHCRADSHVVIQPNSSAGTALFNGAKYPYVAQTNEGNFVVQTGNGTAAAGTETLKYVIL
jgi:hypothetical protein